MEKKMYVVQTKNGTHSADFDILDDEKEALGRAVMQGSFASKSVGFQIMYGPHLGLVNPATKTDAESVAKDFIVSKAAKPYTWDFGEGYNGLLYHDYVKTGFLEKAGFYSLCYKGEIYYMYSVGRALNGTTMLVFKDAVKIGEIQKPCDVVDGLHEFELTFKDDEPEFGEVNDIILVLFSCYTYMLDYYHPGAKAKPGTQTNTVVTTNPFLLSKLEADADGRPVVKEAESETEVAADVAASDDAAEENKANEVISNFVAKSCHMVANAWCTCKNVVTAMPHVFQMMFQRMTFH